MANNVLLVTVGCGYKDTKEKHAYEVNRINEFLVKVGINHVVPSWDSDRETTYYSIESFEVLVDKDQFIDLAHTDLFHSVKIKARYDLPDVQEQFQNIAQKVQRLIDKLSEVEANTSKFDQSWNDKCDVHVPGLGLLSINRTLLLEDCCSDQLQSHISDGWRIIAACPQPDQRRPDYILGKYDAGCELEPRNSADR